CEAAGSRPVAPDNLARVGGAPPRHAPNRHSIVLAPIDRHGPLPRADPAMPAALLRLGLGQIQVPRGWRLAPGAAHRSRGQPSRSLRPRRPEAGPVLSPSPPAGTHARIVAALARRATAVRALLSRRRDRGATGPRAPRARFPRRVPSGAGPRS